MTFKLVTLPELLRAVHKMKITPGKRVLHRTDSHFGWYNTPMLGIALHESTFKEEPEEEMSIDISWYDNTLGNKFAFIRINSQGTAIYLLEEEDK